jgi:hypothetical protein
MNENFQELLRLYKEGNLDEAQARLVEDEIQRVSAIMEYVQEEENDFWDPLKQENLEEIKPAISASPQFKRRVNTRIIGTTALTVLAVWITLAVLTLLTSRVMTSLFAMDYKESYVERSAFTQVVEMFHPDYRFASSYNTVSPFARSSIGVQLIRTVGHTTLDNKDIEVEYRMGQPKKRTDMDEMLHYPMVEEYANLSGGEPSGLESFTILKNAPSGTTAKVLILYKEPISPEALKTRYLDPLFATSPDGVLQEVATPLAVVDNGLVIANPSYYRYTPVYPYDPDQKMINEQRGALQSTFEAYDDQAHVDSFIGNLQILQEHEALLEVLFHESFLDTVDLDKAISNVRSNGLRYVGVYINADTKALLQFQEDPNIHGMQVLSIVLW